MGFTLKSVKNSRELGGYAAMDGRHIKSGLLLRTAKLNGISDEEAALLSDYYKVSDIIDFRSPMEIAGAEDPEISGAQYHNLDVMQLTDSQFAPFAEVGVIPDDVREVVELMQRFELVGSPLYIKYLDSACGKRSFGEFFRILLSAEPNRAVLWHCTSGKDRTGLAAMLLLSALGVDEETIISDYMLTNTFNAASIAGMTHYFTSLGWEKELVKDALIAFESVDEEFMRDSIAHLKAVYGSVPGYINAALGISENDIEKLKARYLT